MTLATPLFRFCAGCLVLAALLLTPPPVSGQGNATKKADTPKKTKKEKEREKEAAEAAKKKGPAAGTAQGQPPTSTPTSVTQKAANQLAAQTTTATTGPSPLEVSLATARELRDAAQKRSGTPGVYDEYLRRIGAIKERAGAPPDVEAHLKALSIGMIRLGDALQAQAETVQKSAAEKSELKALLAQQEVSDLRDAAAGPAALVVDLGSGRDKLAAAPKTNTRWEDPESAMREAKASAQGNVWAAAAKALEDRVKAEQQARAEQLRAQQQAQQQQAQQQQAQEQSQGAQSQQPQSTQASPSGLGPDNPAWIYGEWRRADGENPNSALSMKITSDRWTIRANGDPCELTMRSSVYNPDRTGVVTLTGVMTNGNTVIAVLHPDATGGSFSLYVQTERLPACLDRDVKYVRAGGIRPTGAVIHNANTNPVGTPSDPRQVTPPNAARPICNLAGTTWQSDDKDKPWTLFFREADTAGNFAGDLSPQDPKLGPTVKLRVQCNGPRRAYLTPLQDNGDSGTGAQAELDGEKTLKLNVPLPNKDKGVKKFKR